MKEDRKEFVGYLPICPITPEHPDMLIGIPFGHEAEKPSVPAGLSDFAPDTETWD